MKHMVILSASALALAAACTPVEYEDHWMDSPSTEDASLTDPSYLVSTRIETPTETEKDTPVIVTAHGFSSATPQMREFQLWGEERGILVSNVLLGGHGRSLDAWLETDQYDWGAPIFDEYESLVDKGYRHISIAVESTAVPLTLLHMMEGGFDDLPAPERLLFLSPFIVSADERLYIAPVIGPVLNNVPSNNTEWEKERMYTNRPHPVFTPLMDLLNGVAGQLDGEGINLPEGSTVHVWHAEREGTIHPDGITKLEAGLHGDQAVEVIRFDSDRHGFIRAAGHPRTADEASPVEDGEEPHLWTEDDDAFQIDAFETMLELVTAAG